MSKTIEHTIYAQCPFDPKIYGSDVPIGMFHCPYCGEMVLAGFDHVPYMTEFDRDDYHAMILEIKEVWKQINDNKSSTL